MKLNIPWFIDHDRILHNHLKIPRIKIKQKNGEREHLEHIHYIMLACFTNIIIAIFLGQR